MLNLLYRHGRGHTFSCKAIKIAVQFFQKLGHREILVILPESRKLKGGIPMKDRHILKELADRIVYTPLGDYDDR